MQQAQTAASQSTFVVTRTLRAPIERVFRAWTEAAELARWFSPSPNSTIVASVDFRIGGEYRIEIHHQDGTVYTVIGSYQEIQAPHKVAFSWRWEHDPNAVESRVEVELRRLGESTELTLSHSNLPTEIEREKHSHGWKGCLDRLETYV